MCCCPSRSSSARSSASASATRSPPRRRRACGWAGCRCSGIGQRTANSSFVDSEAEIVRLIFRRYAELGSVRLLKEELEAQGIQSKAWTSASGRITGGRPFSRGALYLILQNRTYLGEIVHKGQSHPGEHAPIIDQPLWDVAQAQLAANTAERNFGTRTRQPSLLTGMLFDADGNQMTPSHAVKKGHALPLLCLPSADYQRPERRVRRAAAPSRSDRATRDQPRAPMASRSRQHLPGDTRYRSDGAAPAHRARRGTRQKLAAVARTTSARLDCRSGGTHRHRCQPGRYPSPRKRARRALR